MLQPDRCYIVGEIGINHNGNMGMVRKLMDVAHAAGCDAVKFQKRTIDIVYSPEELAKPRESVFGATNGDLKRGLELGRAEYDEIDSYAKTLGIDWYASPWDELSVAFLMKYSIPYIKVASPCVTDKELLCYCVATGKPLLLSTGMCDLQLIHRIVQYARTIGGRIACLYHCTSTYPGMPEELNLRGIETLHREFPDIPIGYSGHEPGLSTSVMAAVLGAASVERHITLDRSMPGSDQPASLEPAGLDRLVRDIRLWERARGDGTIRVYDSEVPVRQKLRRRDSFRPSPSAELPLQRPPSTPQPPTPI